MEKKIFNIGLAVIGIVGILILSFTIIMLIYLHLTIAFNILDFGKNILGVLSIIILFMLFSSLYIYYSFTKEGLKENLKARRIFDYVSSKKWFIIWVGICIFLIIISCSVIQTYPGIQDLDKEYSDWKIKDGYGLDSDFRTNFSSIRIESLKYGRKYFIENDEIKLKFEFRNIEFYIASLEVKGIGNNSAIWSCENNSCYAVINLNSMVEEIKIIPQIIQIGNVSNIQNPVIMKIYPNIISEEEAKEKDKEKSLFIGSLVSIILITSSVFINQIRHIWYNKQD